MTNVILQRKMYRTDMESSCWSIILLKVL